MNEEEEYEEIAGEVRNKEQEMDWSDLTLTL